MKPSFVIEIRHGGIKPARKWRESTIQQGLRSAYLAMNVGDHFDWNGHTQDAYRAAKSVGAKIETHKTNDGRRTVWLIKKP